MLRRYLMVRHRFARRGRLPRLLALLAALTMGGTAVGQEAAAPAAPADKAAAGEVPAALPAGRYTVLDQRPDRLLVQLDNGLIVIAQEMPTAPVVSAQVYVKTGSIYEQEHVGAGLSHFLEHLISGGSTTARGEEQSNAILGRIGARTNASTSLDNVRYYINTTRDYAADAVELLSDWMQHSIISEEEFRRERAVIQREFEMGEGEPGRIFWKLTQQARHRTHPARHPTIGYLDEFLTITRDEIYDFYRRMYVPNNMVFVVVGDIDKTAVVEQVARLWAEAKPGKLPALSFPIEPEIDGPRAASGYARMERPLPRLRLAWPGTRLTEEHDYALDLLAVVLGRGESSRLVRSVRDEARAVYSVGSYNLSHHWGQGFFGIDAEVVVPPPPEGAEAAEVEELTQRAIARAKDLILAEVDRVLADGVTAAELARAKRETLAAVLYEGQTAQEVAERLASDLIATGDPDYLRRYVREIEQLTEADLVAAAQRFLTAQRLLTLTLLPLPEGQGPTPLTRPGDAAIDKTGPLEPVDLDNARLVARFRAVQRDEGGTAPLTIEPIERFVLSNGLRVVVQRSNIVPAVAMQLYQLGGLLADEPGREGLANATAAMQMKGTTTRSAQQISSALDDLGARMSASVGNQTSFVRAVSLAPDWPAVLELLADVTLQPTFAQEEWDKLRPRLVASIHRQNDQWSGLLGSRFRQAYFGDHVWSETPAGKADVVAALTPRELADFHRRHLGASQAVLAVFGDVDPAEVRTRAESLFTAMPGKPAIEFEPAPPPPPVAGTLVQVVTAVPPAAAQIGFGPGATRLSPDFPALQVLSRVLSSFPTGWLDVELRGGQTGLVYAVWGYPMSGLVPGFYAVGFNAQPDAVSETLARAMGVVERAKAEPVDEETLGRAKAGVLADEFLAKQSNGDRATEAALNELYGLGLDEPERFRRAVEATTAQEVRAAAQKYLNNPVAVVITHRPLPEDSLRAALRGEAPAPAPPAGGADGETLLAP